MQRQKCYFPSWMTHDSLEFHVQTAHVGCNCGNCGVDIPIPNSWGCFSRGRFFRYGLSISSNVAQFLPHSPLHKIWFFHFFDLRPHSAAFPAIPRNSCHSKFKSNEITDALSELLCVLNLSKHIFLHWINLNRVFFLIHSAAFKTHQVELSCPRHLVGVGPS